MTTVMALAVAGLVVVLIIFSTVRRIAAIAMSLVITLAASAVAIGGMAVLMNNVAINEPPGIRARIHRFLTVDWAATSAKGTSLATCQDSAESAASQGGAAVEATPQRRASRRSAAGRPTPTPSAAAATGGEEEFYPELVRRGYPGLTRTKLFALARQTVSELGGWKVVKEDARAYRLECIYTTRLLRFEDEIKVMVTPRSEINLCSHSGVGAEDTGALRWFFGGDFGANIGHIKEFYSSLEPKVDQAYREQERKQGER